MTDNDRKARVTQEMELLGPEAMTRSLRAFPWQPMEERQTPCHCILGFAQLTDQTPIGEAWMAARRLAGGHVARVPAIETMYENGDADVLHTWILEWLELNRVAAPPPVPAPVPPLAADCPRCCQVEYGITRHCADHCEEGMPF